LEGLLSRTIQDSDIPPTFPIRLQTKSWIYLLPNLANLYPNNNQMIINSYATASPSFQTTANEGSTIIMQVNFDVFVITNKQVPAFTLSGEIQIQGIEITISNGKLYGTLDNMKLTNYVISKTEIGTFNGAIVADLINLAFGYAILPDINSQLEAGYIIDLPKGVSLVSPILVVSSGITTVVTNIAYVQEIIRVGKIPINVL